MNDPLNLSAVLSFVGSLLGFVGGILSCCDFVIKRDHGKGFWGWVHWSSFINVGLYVLWVIILIGGSLIFFCYGVWSALPVAIFAVGGIVTGIFLVWLVKLTFRRGNSLGYTIIATWDEMESMLIDKSKYAKRVSILDPNGEFLVHSNKQFNAIIDDIKKRAVRYTFILQDNEEKVSDNVEDRLNELKKTNKTTRMRLHTDDEFWGMSGRFCFDEIGSSAILGVRIDNERVDLLVLTNTTFVNSLYSLLIRLSVDVL